MPPGQLPMLLLTCWSGASVMLPVAVELPRTARVVDDNVVFSSWTWLHSPKPKAIERRDAMRLLQALCIPRLALATHAAKASCARSFGTEYLGPHVIT